MVFEDISCLVRKPIMAKDSMDIAILKEMGISTRNVRNLDNAAEYLSFVQDRYDIWTSIHEDELNYLNEDESSSVSLIRYLSELIDCAVCSEKIDNDYKVNLIIIMNEYISKLTWNISNIIHQLRTDNQNLNEEVYRIQSLREIEARKAESTNNNKMRQAILSSSYNSTDIKLLSENLAKSKEELEHIAYENVNLKKKTHTQHMEINQLSNFNHSLNTELLKRIDKKLLKRTCFCNLSQKTRETIVKNICKSYRVRPVNLSKIPDGTQNEIQLKDEILKQSDFIMDFKNEKYYIVRTYGYQDLNISINKSQTNSNSIDIMILKASHWSPSGIFTTNRELLTIKGDEIIIISSGENYVEDKLTIISRNHIKQTISILEIFDNETNEFVFNETYSYGDKIKENKLSSILDYYENEFLFGSYPQKYEKEIEGLVADANTIDYIINMTYGDDSISIVKV